MRASTFSGAPQADRLPPSLHAESQKMPNKRELTVHYMDGSSMKIDFPVQTPNESAQVIKLKQALAARHLVVEADGALLIIPYENVKYIQAYPAPAKLPDNVIRAASFTA
jgi:hypothetical protein